MVKEKKKTGGGISHLANSFPANFYIALRYLPILLIRQTQIMDGPGKRFFFFFSFLGRLGPSKPTHRRPIIGAEVFDR